MQTRQPLPNQFPGFLCSKGVYDLCKDNNEQKTENNIRQLFIVAADIAILRSTKGEVKKLESLGDTILITHNDKGGLTLYTPTES